MLLLWSGGYLPAGVTGTILAAMPLLASSYQFCRVDAKTDDHFFLGFPSYWNVIAFYAIIMHLSPTIVGAILILCSILVFVPIRYLYPSRTVAFRTTTLAVSGIWIICYIVLLTQMPRPSALLTNISLLGVAYYVLMSVYLTFKRRHIAPMGIQH